jgi:hypothetical protein
MPPQRAQEIADFSSKLRNLAAEGRYDLYVTESNAHLLSGELVWRRTII